MKTIWIFLMNVFANVTRDSFRLALRITMYHYSALKARVADEFILALFIVYEPIHNEFVAAYTAWKKQMAVQQSKTVAFDSLLKQLSSKKIRKWVGKISSLYDKDTEMYKLLLPHNSTPFQSGSQYDRLDALSQLIIAIGSIAELAELKAEMEAFLALLNKAYEEQKGAMSQTQSFSKALEEARIKMCTAQYSNLGGLMQHFALTPLFTGDLFDQKAIRHGDQLLFICTIKAKKVKTIFKRTMVVDEELTLENDGVTELRFYLATEKNAAIGDTYVVVPANSKTTVKAADLGNVETMHFLIVANPDTINSGECTVELV